MTTPVRKKLIEVSIPLEAINAESSQRKQKAPKGYPTAIHKYWAQRPVAACRAVLFAQIVDDPSAWPDRFSTEAAQDDERKRLHKIMEQMLRWEASNNDVVLQSARWEIARSIAWGLGEEPPPPEDGRAILEFLQTKGPPVYDPFSGAASIPLEAQRLGLRTRASDLNPVAVLIGKALVEIPPRFFGLPPVNPDARATAINGQIRDWKGAEGLAEDVRYYGKWMRDRALARIGDLYPQAQLTDNSRGTVVAWLWARTVKSPDPAAMGAMVPLVSSFILSNKEGRKVCVRPVLDPSAPDGWRFEVSSGILSENEEAVLKKGTIGRSGGGTCILTGASMPFSYIREYGQAHGLGQRLMAVVAESRSGRVYISPTDEHENAALTATPTWEPGAELPSNPRDFKTPNYGMRTFGSLFTRRQLVAHTTFSDLITEARLQVVADTAQSTLADDPASLCEGGSGRAAYGDALATYLTLMVDRMVFYGSSLCGWLAKDNAMGKSMPQQALAMSWDFAEGNPFGKSSADALTCTRAVADCVEVLRSSVGGQVSQSDACMVDYDKDGLISTDPPYYDNFGYAELSDFFYPWMKASLSTIYPDLFRRLATPKDAELVDNVIR